MEDDLTIQRKKMVVVLAWETGSSNKLMKHRERKKRKNVTYIQMTLGKYRQKERYNISRLKTKKDRKKKFILIYKNSERKFQH